MVMGISHPSCWLCLFTRTVIALQRSYWRSFVSGFRSQSSSRQPQSGPGGGNWSAQDYHINTQLWIIGLSSRSSVSSSCSLKRCFSIAGPCSKTVVIKVLYDQCAVFDYVDYPDGSYVETIDSCLSSTVFVSFVIVFQ